MKNEVVDALSNLKYRIKNEKITKILKNDFTDSTVMERDYVSTFLTRATGNDIYNLLVGIEEIEKEIEHEVKSAIKEISNENV